MGKRPGQKSRGMAPGRLNSLRASPLTKTVSVCAERVKWPGRRARKEAFVAAGSVSYVGRYHCFAGARRDGGGRPQRTKARSRLPILPAASADPIYAAKLLL
jgi:hypothetical protein